MWTQGRYKKLIIALLLFWPILLLAKPIAITHLKMSSKPHQWRLVFNATGPIHFKALRLHHPDRLVFDIRNAYLRRRILHRSFVGSPIIRIRTSKSRSHLRLVLDLEYPVKLKAFVLKRHHHRPNRLVIDLFDRQQKVLAFSWPFKNKWHTEKWNSTHFHRKLHLPKLVSLQPKIKSSKTKQLRQVIIVIDPGHGGKDPGASGRRGTHEKNITLRIALNLRRIINKQPGFKAVLTRHGDYYLTLRRRLEIARKYKADMFISIHADAFKNREAHGASVFALSQRGATSEAARWLAARENESELMGGVDLANKNNLLKSVLLNLSQTATIRASLHIGQALLQSLTKVARLHHTKVEQAAFVVLKSPDIPSLLVETGFLSNRREELKLRNVKYRHAIALALEKGIKNYFIHRPPRKTWLAYWRDHPRLRPKHYIVVAGDTLSSIADRYRVSVRTLRDMNKLRNSRLSVGKVLLIPPLRAS